MLSAFAPRLLSYSRNCCCRPTMMIRQQQKQLVQKRGMAGAYPADMAVKKNKFIEEWNGRREITEKSFEIGFAQAPTFIIFLLILPYGIYTWCRSEFLSGTDRRYKDIF